MCLRWTEKINKLKLQLDISSFCLFFSVSEEDTSNVQIMCAWCQKVGVKRYSLSMGSELKSFCSEKCFAACRRAYFKRNKVKGRSISASSCPFSQLGYLFLTSLSSSFTLFSVTKFSGQKCIQNTHTSD